MSSCRIILVSVVFGVLYLQIATAQCIPPIGLAYGPEVSGGGGFTVRSSSPIAPSGVTVLSDRLVIEGPLVVDGQLPFLGTVALQGTLPAGGAGTVSHSCGGALGITSEIGPALGPLGPGMGPLGPGVGPLGPGVGPVGPGLNGLAGPVRPMPNLGQPGPGVRPVGPRGLY